jgi:hypothetical protein
MDFIDRHTTNNLLLKRFCTEFPLEVDIFEPFSNLQAFFLYLIMTYFFDFGAPFDIEVFKDVNRPKTWHSLVINTIINNASSDESFIRDLIP